MSYIDVAIIGGGPAGSTVGSFLRKYGNDLKVTILERETFPRDHVGESQLPGTSRILNELGVWDRVEAANFPIKLGATYKWGRSGELWDFDFASPETLKGAPRPGKYDSVRVPLAFQVDRSVYDKILLDYSAELGCEVRENTRVLKVNREGDRITGLTLESGEEIEARYYIDASGHSGILRRAMGVRTDSPTTLQNVAIWDYWRNAEWAEEIGVGGTRVQVISVGNGWVWFIPLGPDRTSIGLIVPAEHYKSQGLSAADLYARALGEDERLAGLMRNAVSEGNLQTTKDWSFLSERHSGENWFLAGEASGFADPILSAGMTISHYSGREVAFTILEADRGEDPRWLREVYGERQRVRIMNHIRFADYWYSANSQFTDLQEHTAEIARQNGLDLDPAKAWAWLAQGGFIEDNGAGTAGFALPLFRELTGYLGDAKTDSPIYEKNVFRLNLEGASLESHPIYDAGRVTRVQSYSREGKGLPIKWPYQFWIEALESQPDIDKLKQGLLNHLVKITDPTLRGLEYNSLMPALDAMILEGWVEATYDPEKPLFNRQGNVAMVHKHEFV